MIGWSVVCALAAIVAAVLFAERAKTERLRQEVEDERAKLEHEGRGLERESRKSSEPAVDLAELERLRGDRVALERLREEVARLKTSVAETRPLPVRRPKETEGAAPDIEKEIVPASAWRNAGYATPAAAIETALWAAAGGDTELLMKSCVLEEGARRKAEALLASLPKEMQARYATPEDLVAFMTAKDVPLEGARILAFRDPADDPQRQAERPSAAVQLRNAAGSVRQVHIELRDTPGGWRLVVPESAVTRYAEQLKGRGR
jgi:hypothetical protein